MTQDEADKIAIVLSNAYGPAIWDLCQMLNEANLGFVWLLRGEEPRFEPAPLDGWLMTFAELPAGEVTAAETI